MLVESMNFMYNKILNLFFCFLFLSFHSLFHFPSFDFRRHTVIVIE